MPGPVGHDSFELLLHTVTDAQGSELISSNPSPELIASGPPCTASPSSAGGGHTNASAWTSRRKTRLQHPVSTPGPPGSAIGPVSLESYNYPGRYLSYRANVELWLDPSDSTNAFRVSSSYYAIALWV
ncbi:hypothetical protein ABIA33_007151 [Streptacidiphilus sp. MAP12-16]|jgi:hypothetical protein